MNAGSFGTTTRPGGGLYSQDGINSLETGGLCEDLRGQHHVQHDYRSLPHNKNNRSSAYVINNLSNQYHQQQPNNYTVVSTASSTPRSRPQQQPQSRSTHGSTPRSQHYDRDSLNLGEPAEFSGASDNRSENTVIEQDQNSFSASSIVGLGGGRRASNTRSIVSNMSNCNQQDGGSVGGEPAGGYLVVQGVGGPVAHVVGLEDDDDDDFILEDEGPASHLSSEDNLSHDSYELIERVGGNSSIGELAKPSNNVPITSAANQFEQEFYRQAAASKNNGLNSSRTSSHCSLSMSPKIVKNNRNENGGSNAEINNGSHTTSEANIAVTASTPTATSTLTATAISRVKSADSFSQASNHSNQIHQVAKIGSAGAGISTIEKQLSPNLSQTATTVVVSQDPPETSFTSTRAIAPHPLSSQNPVSEINNATMHATSHAGVVGVSRQDIIRGHGGGRPQQQPQTYVEVISADGPDGQPTAYFAHLMQQPHQQQQQQQRIPDFTHSLPRASTEGYIVYHHHPAGPAPPQQGILRGGANIVPHGGHGHATSQHHGVSFSRTLPNRRRERSPVYYSRSRLAPGVVVGPSGNLLHHQECSSGSSSSHASPLIARPKSLEFAVVNVNALPNKQSFGYHDDSLEQENPPGSIQGGIVGGVSGGGGGSGGLGNSNQLLKQPPLDLYDDSSSAINEQLSSSDVPQTPENANVTFLPLEAGPVIVGCHQGVVAGLHSIHGPEVHQMTGSRTKQQYYETEERIYDVPEGIEGISAPIKVRKPLLMASMGGSSSAAAASTAGGTLAASAAAASGSITTTSASASNNTMNLALSEIVTSPSSSSGITEPFVPKTNITTTTTKTSPPPPCPPPHKPVIAQPVRHSRLRLTSRDQTSSNKLPKVDIDPRKFHNLLSAMEPQDSTESNDSTSFGGGMIVNKPQQRPMRPTRGRGNSQSHYSTTTLPPPQRALLATMSSTESESAMSARSAPTPISNPDILMKTTNAAAYLDEELEDEYDDVEEDEDEEDDFDINSDNRNRNISSTNAQQQQLGPDRHVGQQQQQQRHHQIPHFQVNLISPPAEDQSESSTAVLDVPGCTPPPEFSGAGVINNEDPLEATDVEDESQSHATPKPEDGNPEEDEKQDQEQKNKTDDNISETTKEPLEDMIMEEIEEEEEEGSSKVIKVADLYVKLEHTANGSGSTISEEGNTGSDIAPVPFIDDNSDGKENEQDLIEHLDGINDAASENVDYRAKVVSLPSKQIAELVFIASEAETLSKSEDISKELEEEAEEILEQDAEIDKTIHPISHDSNIEDTKNDNDNEDLHDDVKDVEVVPVPEKEFTQPDVVVVETSGTSATATIDRLPSLPTLDSTQSSMEIEIEHIPPPPTHCDFQDGKSAAGVAGPQKSITSEESVSPPPPPEELVGSDDNGPPTAIPKMGGNSSNNSSGFPFPPAPLPAPRTLSRISEASNTANASNNKVENTIKAAVMPPQNDQLGSPARSVSETITDQNCTTSVHEGAESEEDDAIVNPPSLNSDLPENTASGSGSRVGGVMRAIAEFEAKAMHQNLSQSTNTTSTASTKIGQTGGQHSSDHLPSPPSSLLNTTTEEEEDQTEVTCTQEACPKTEVTLIDPDSLFLEIAPDPYVSTIDRSDDEGSPVELVEGAPRDKIPYDLSISSENEVTNKEFMLQEGGQKSDDGNNSEGSLHDSMEILEEIATEDHFDHDIIDDDEHEESDDQASDAEADQTRDIFEMPPMPNTFSAAASDANNTNNDQESPSTDPPAVGGQEFIF